VLVFKASFPIGTSRDELRWKKVAGLAVFKPGLRRLTTHAKGTANESPPLQGAFLGMKKR
jgi:hypothetical protein